VVIDCEIPVAAICHYLIQAVASLVREVLGEVGDLRPRNL
jgi:hypothetical protein